MREKYKICHNVLQRARRITRIIVFVGVFLMPGSVENMAPQIKATTSYEKPSQSSLWINTDASNGLIDTRFWSLATNSQHSVIAPFPHNAWHVYAIGNRWSIRTNLDAGEGDFLRRRQGSWEWSNMMLRENNGNASITFAGFRIFQPNKWIAGDFESHFFVPYNVTGYVADISMSAIPLGYISNLSAYVKSDFQFADDVVNYQTGDYGWRTGNGTASWNSSMQAIVAQSVSQKGYTALATRLRPDTTGTWTFTYTIWDSSSSFYTWMTDKRSLDNATHGSLPTTSTNVYGALAYNNTSTTNGTYKLHFTAYIAFGGSMNELSSNLGNLTVLDPLQSYTDTNQYWYEAYTKYSALNFGNDNLNRLYYWSKHLISVAHYGKRYFGAGFEYQNGYLNYCQDSAYGVLNSLAGGLWDNAKRYLDNVLTYAVDTNPNGYADGFNSGTPYKTTNLVTWTLTMFQTEMPSAGTVRSSLDFLDSAVRYIAYSGNTTFARVNWSKLTKMIEAVQGAVTATGVLPLTRDTEDSDSSLQCNIIYYHVLKEFSKISHLIGDSTYASSLENRAVTLKTQLNKEVGYGGLWSSLNGYFVNSSNVSPTDPNPSLWLWHNAEAIHYDAPDSHTKKLQILSAIASKLEGKYGFYSTQTLPWSRTIWYMKLYELAKAYASMEDASKISGIVWSYVNNPYSGLTNATPSTRLNFPEFWVDSGVTWAYDFQYVWSSSFVSLASEVLLGIRPDIHNINIQPIKPTNVSSITGINMQARDAMWNVSISGYGNYVDTITVDGTTLSSRVIPSAYYIGNHTIEVTLGSNRPLNPFLVETTGRLSSVKYDSNVLIAMLSSPSGSATTTKIYVGDKDEPYCICGVAYNLTSDYLEVSRTLTLTARSVTEISVDFNMLLLGMRYQSVANGKIISGTQNGILRRLSVKISSVGDSQTIIQIYTNGHLPRIVKLNDAYLDPSQYTYNQLTKIFTLTVSFTGECKIDMFFAFTDMEVVALAGMCAFSGFLMVLRNLLIKIRYKKQKMLNRLLVFSAISMASFVVTYTILVYAGII